MLAPSRARSRRWSSRAARCSRLRPESRQPCRQCPRWLPRPRGAHLPRSPSQAKQRSRTPSCRPNRPHHPPNNPLLPRRRPRAPWNVVTARRAATGVTADLAGAGAAADAGGSVARGVTSRLQSTHPAVLTNPARVNRGLTRRTSPRQRLPRAKSSSSPVNRWQNTKAESRLRRHPPQIRKFRQVVSPRRRSTAYHSRSQRPNHTAKVSAPRCRNRYTLGVFPSCQRSLKTISRVGRSLLG